MKKNLIFILLIFSLAKVNLSTDQEEKICWDIYDITFVVYKYLTGDQLKDKELLGSQKKEIFKRGITAWEDKIYIKDYIIDNHIRIKFRFDFKEFLKLKIYINNQESISFQNKAAEFKLNFKTFKNGNYLIETTFVVYRVGLIPPPDRFIRIKPTKKRIIK